MKNAARIRTCVTYAAIVFVTFEIAARTEDFVRYDAPFWESYTIEGLFQPSEFGRTGKPHARYAKWSLNSLGYRGPEPVPGRINVLTFGASETFGLYESPGNEYPRQLERELDRAEERFNVVNIAIPGMSIGKIDYLERAEIQLAPRYAVIYPSPANYIGTTQPFCGRTTPPVPSQVSLLDHVRVLGRLRDLSKRVVSPDMMTVARRAAARFETRDQVVQERVHEETIDAFRRDLSCIVDSAKRHHVTVILVTHPTFFGQDRSAPLTELDRQQLSAWRRFYPELAEDGLLDLERRTDAALRGYAVEAGIQVVDAAGEVPPGPKYFADFVHLTDLGAAIVARLVAQRITSDEHQVLIEASTRGNG